MGSVGGIEALQGLYITGASFTTPHQIPGSSSEEGKASRSPSSQTGQCKGHENPRIGAALKIFERLHKIRIALARKAGNQRSKIRRHSMVTRVAYSGCRRI